MINTISVVIIAKDAQETIKACLESLKDFEEVILYLNNSSDKTKEIAELYRNVQIIKGDFIGFGETKNRAGSYAKNRWIFSLDSDEVLTQELIETLKTFQPQPQTLYAIDRSNYYKTQQIKHCWGNDILVRLYNRTETEFSPHKVHEYIIEKNLTKTILKGRLKHYPYNNMSDFIVKLDRYSTIFAQENTGKKNSSPLKAILNAHYSFFRTYILKRGFLDGYAGLVIAFSHMATNFYKYMKLYEANKALKK